MAKLTGEICVLADDLRELESLREEVAALRTEVVELRHVRDLFRAIGGGKDSPDVVIRSRWGAEGDDWQAYDLIDWGWGKTIATAENYGTALQDLAEKAVKHHDASERARVIAGNKLPLWEQQEWVRQQAFRDIEPAEGNKQE